jgi:hypothetical protein
MSEKLNTLFYLKHVKCPKQCIFGYFLLNYLKAIMEIIGIFVDLIFLILDANQYRIKTSLSNFCEWKEIFMCLNITMNILAESSEILMSKQRR